MMSTNGLRDCKPLGTITMNKSLVRVLGLASVSAALIVGLGGDERRASGQDPAPAGKKADERPARLAEMEFIAQAIRVVAIDDQEQQVPAVMAPKPLHRWTDPTREFSDGGLWVWRSSGRPVAVIGIELYSYWSLEFVSLSTGRVKAEYGRVRWTPQKGGGDFKDVPDAPRPAETEAGRLRQMSELAKRFSAREVWVNATGQHYALRLLPRPIDRYADSGSGVADGGLFIFANGTNPEILLMVEARKRGEGPPKWMFAAMPLSHAEVSLALGKQDVWTSPSKDAGQGVRPSDPYYDVLTPRVKVPAAKEEPKAPPK